VVFLVSTNIILQVREEIDEEDKQRRVHEWSVYFDSFVGSPNRGDDEESRAREGKRVTEGVRES
jgi:hypothetical protein